MSQALVSCLPHDCSRAAEAQSALSYIPILSLLVFMAVVTNTYFAALPGPTGTMLF